MKSSNSAYYSIFNVNQRVPENNFGIFSILACNLGMEYISTWHLAFEILLMLMVVSVTHINNE